MTTTKLLLLLQPPQLPQQVRRRQTDAGETGPTSGKGQGIDGKMDG